MRALISGEQSGLAGLKLVDAPVPQPGMGEVRIKVAMVGVNYPDVLMIEDRYQYRPPRPFTPGIELAGTIDALGEGVVGWAVGDRVVALINCGGMAEYVVAPNARVHRVPDAIAATDAAALTVTYGTMLHALTDRAALQAGETVLVLGAAGGIGMATVQLAKALGAQVVAAVSSEEKARVALDNGADRTVVYPAGELDRDGQRALSKLFKDACGEHGADVVVDPVGGHYSEPALRAIAWHGRFLVVGFPAGIASIPLNLPLIKACTVIGVLFGAELERGSVNLGSVLERLFKLCKAGLRPTIDRIVPLTEAVQAIASLKDRKANGKLLVSIDA